MLNDRKASDAKAWAIVALETLVETRRDVAFSRPDFVACTGAITDDVAEQIAEAKSARRPGLSGGDPDNMAWIAALPDPDQWDLVTLSLGGNNVGFASIAKGCLDMVSSAVPSAAAPGSLLWNNPYWGGCDQSLEELTKRADVLSGEATCVNGKHGFFVNKGSLSTF